MTMMVLAQATRRRAQRSVQTVKMVSQHEVVTAVIRLTAALPANVNKKRLLTVRL